MSAVRAEWVRGDVVVLDGVEVARVRSSPWSTRARATIHGATWSLRRGRREYTALSDGAAFSVARDRASADRWWATSPTARYEITRAGPLGVGLALARDGVPVGRAGFTEGAAPRALLECDPSVPADDAVLLLWFWHALAAASQ